MEECSVLLWGKLGNRGSLNAHNLCWTFGKGEWWSCSHSPWGSCASAVLMTATAKSMSASVMHMGGLILSTWRQEVQKNCFRKFAESMSQYRQTKGCRTWHVWFNRSSQRCVGKIRMNEVARIVCAGYWHKLSTFVSRNACARDHTELFHPPCLPILPQSWIVGLYNCGIVKL